MRVMLAAIAKDEAAYIPEWVHHHLWMGFDEIKIYLNSISDNSEDILAGIEAHYPQVKHEYCDDLAFMEIDLHEDRFARKDFVKRNPIQSRAYSRALSYAKEYGFDYVCFLDIDEFFFSPDGYGIKAALQRYETPDIIRFRWFNLSGFSKPFASTVNNKVVGSKSKQFKFCISCNLGFDPVLVSSHQVLTPKGSRVSLSGYGDIGSSYRLKNDVSWSDDFFILHNLLRSEVEYLSLLYRGDNFVNSRSGLKLNRKGFSVQGKQVLIIEPAVSESIARSFQEFISCCGIEKDLQRSREFVVERAELTKKAVDAFMSDHQSLVKVLKGTYLSDSYN